MSEQVKTDETAPLPDSWCNFDARLVPFLAAAGQDVLGRARGISISPHPLGGVSLAATSGPILCAAHDPSGKVNDEGMSLVIPQLAVDACRPPRPMTFPDQGDVFEVPAPDYCWPDRILSTGASLLVWPKEQPVDPGRCEEDGLPLWSGIIETGRVYREDDCRREKPFDWSRMIKSVDPDTASRPVYIGTEVMAKVAQAMRASGVDFWRQLQINDETTLFLPAKERFESDSPSLAIYVAHGRAAALTPVIDTPDWLSVLGKRECVENV